MKCEKCGCPDVWDDYDGVTLCSNCRPAQPCYGYVPSFSGQWGGGLQWFTSLDKLIGYARTVTKVRARYVMWARHPMWRIRAPGHAYLSSNPHDLGFIENPTPEQITELRRIEEPPLKGEISAWKQGDRDP